MYFRGGSFWGCSKVIKRAKKGSKRGSQKEGVLGVYRKHGFMRIYVLSRNIRGFRVKTAMRGQKGCFLGYTGNTYFRVLLFLSRNIRGFRVKMAIGGKKGCF